jgi:hypothetical protein
MKFIKKYFHKFWLAWYVYNNQVLCTCIRCINIKCIEKWIITLEQNKWGTTNTTVSKIDLFRALMIITYNAFYTITAFNKIHLDLHFELSDFWANKKLWIYGFLRRWSFLAEILPFGKKGVT